MAQFSAISLYIMAEVWFEQNLPKCIVGTLVFCMENVFNKNPLTPDEF